MKLYKDENFGLICVCAMRYAMGRQTYMPRIVQRFIRENIKTIDDGAISVMYRDICEAVDNGFRYGLGDPEIDAPGWLSLRDFLKAKKEARGRECTHSL